MYVIFYLYMSHVYIFAKVTVNKSKMKRTFLSFYFIEEKVC